jgi:mono/diheme cytochrome c family protein
MTIAAPRRSAVLSVSVSAAVLLAAFSLSSGRASAADPENGERMARRWCASCHVVAPDQRQPTAEATPFAAIGKIPGFNEALLAFFLLHPHPRMPDMNLSRAEAADLAAYIVGMER